MPFLIAFVFAAALMPVCVAAGRAAGLVDRPTGDALKIHARPVAVTGGVGVTIAALVVTAILGRSTWWLPAAAALALATGLVDDVRALPVAPRLALQAAVGLVVVAGGIRIDVLEGLGGAAVVVVVIACANAVNLVDGQDGLAGGLSLLAALGFAALLPPGDGRILALALAGALAGFLPWNRPPARVFLGNGGAYAVGTMLAVLAVLECLRGWSGLLAALVCLGVFAGELVSTVARRAVSRSPLVAGDRGHAYDLAARLLGGRGRSTLVFWAFGAASAGLALLVAEVPAAAGTVVTLLYGAALVGGGWALYRNQHHPTSERT